jgi:hypothetical protein
MLIFRNVIRFVSNSLQEKFTIIFWVTVSFLLSDWDTNLCQMSGQKATVMLFIGFRKVTKSLSVFWLEWESCGPNFRQVCGCLVRYERKLRHLNLCEKRLLSTCPSVRPSVCVYQRGPHLKCTLVQALRLCPGRTAHRGSRGIALPFLDHGTRRG